MALSLNCHSLTDEATGVVGYGEHCPLGPSYLPAFAHGTRAGLAELAPSIIGESAIEVTLCNRSRYFV